MANTNKNLQNAKNSKSDEFYTQLKDVEAEMQYYTEHFKDKVIFCNCDDPTWSAFWEYFHRHFDELGLKRLISSHYEKDGSPSYIMSYEGGNDDNLKTGTKQKLECNGDFRSDECIRLLKKADIVVTNPPFSLFREYINQLIEYGNSFIIVGNQNAVTYKEVFPLFMENKLWLGVNHGDMSFIVPDSYEPRKTRYWKDDKGNSWRSLGNAVWFTNIDHNKRHIPYINTLNAKYSENKYQHYDLFDAIHVNSITDIPYDYYGIMGVPVTYLNYHNPNEFEIVGVFNHGSDGPWDFAKCIVNGKEKYKRIAIRRCGGNCND